MFIATFRAQPMAMHKRREEWGEGGRRGVEKR